MKSPGAEYSSFVSGVKLRYENKMREKWNKFDKRCIAQYAYHSHLNRVVNNQSGERAVSSCRAGARPEVVFTAPTGGTPAGVGLVYVVVEVF